jgi:phytoene synthase
VNDIAVCRERIMRGSKSFSLAARLFDASTQDDAFALYAWCRTCDDAIDGSELGFRDGAAAQPDPEEALRRLTDLISRTRAAYAGQPSDDPVFRAFGAVARRRGIPEHYAIELLEGMAMDIRRQRYETIDDLLLYCYRVAGTVGLMMSHIMGLRDETALRHAADLGIAMQLTNIARDVKDDFEAGRVYLPLRWLADAGVAPDQINDPARRGAVATVARRLIREAECF